MSWYL